MKTRSTWAEFKAHLYSKQLLIKKSFVLIPHGAFCLLFLSLSLFLSSVSLNGSLEEVQLCWFPIKDVNLCSFGQTKFNDYGIIKKGLPLFISLSNSRFWKFLHFWQLYLFFYLLHVLWSRIKQNWNWKRTKELMEEEEKFFSAKVWASLTLSNFWDSNFKQFFQALSSH